MRREVAVAIRAVALLALGGALAACGGGRDNEYVQQTEAGLFVRLPADWTTFQLLEGDPTVDPRVDPAGGAWQVLIDGSASPSRQHLEQVLPDEPLGIVQIEPTPAGTGPTSHLQLRSLLQFDPLAGDPLEDPSLDVVDYAEFDDGDFFGNRLVVDRETDEGTMRITQIAAVDVGSNRVYSFRLFCTPDCYDDHEREIEDVVDSFTLEVSR